MSTAFLEALEDRLHHDAYTLHSEAAREEAFCVPRDNEGGHEILCGDSAAADFEQTEPAATPGGCAFPATPAAQVQ